MSPSKTALSRIREICSELDDAEEFVSHGETAFRVRKRMFAMFASAGTHHGRGRDAVWCKSTLATQSLLVVRNPERIFLPPYVAHQGWIGIWLHGRVSWRMVRELLVSAYELAGARRK